MSKFFLYHTIYDFQNVVNFSHFKNKVFPMYLDRKKKKKKKEFGKFKILEFKVKKTNSLL